MNKNIKQISKLLSLALRHKPSALNIELDENGWTDVAALIDGIKSKGYAVDKNILKDVVSQNDKKRFSFNGDRSKIRANQGHSVHVDVELEERIPPDILYHGTVEKYYQLIKMEGLKKMNRQHVHLTHDLSTAINVGGRRGKPIILKVDTKKMIQEGHTFYLSVNNVWLCECVPSEFISRLDH